MASQQMKTFARRIGVSAIIATILLLAQRAYCAVAYSLVAVSDKETKTVGQGIGKQVALGFDNDGNVMIRYGRSSLTLIYGPEGTADEIKERWGLVPPIKETVGMGEMCIKVGFAF